MIYIIHFGSPKIKAIEQCVAQCGLDFKTIVWNDESLSFENASGFILSGSPTYLTETDFSPYAERYGFLKNVKVPVLGICFGHQVLGMLHGAKIFRGPEERVNTQIQILKNDLLFKSLSNPVLMKEDHTEGINLPLGFEHLASSTVYENEAMKHKDKLMYGVQFHPEVSGEAGMILINSFLKMCP